MKNILIAFLVLFGLLACSQQQRVSTHTPPMDYSEKGPVKNSDFVMTKLENGIDFIASGNEPFWSLEMNFDSSLTFKTLNGDSVVVNTPKGIKPMDVAATGYRTKVGDQDLHIMIFDKPCEDNMSGKEFAKTVHVTYGKNKFNGCGHYLADYRLNDIWVLESINKNSIDLSEFPKGLPRLELNLTRNQVFAFAGCNEFSGAIEILGKRIRFGRFSGTLMACKNMNFESEYLGRLANKTIPFYMEPGKLILQVGADSTFHYKKVD